MWQPDPFPHLVADGLFDTGLLVDVAAEIPPPDDVRWRRYGNDQEFKLEGGPAMWGPATHDYFDALVDRTSWLEELSGIAGLSMETIGGGYHAIPPGGFLQVHTDFNRSPRSGLHRRLNVLTYLNHQWADDDGGQLELWGDHGPEVVVAPEFGRTVIFETSDRSWHGHPAPTRRWRLSVAAYFFSPQPPPGYRADHSTVWRAA